MRNLLKYNVVAVFVLLAFSACKKEYESIEQIDERKIEEYIKANNLNLTKDASGFYYKVISEGTGEIPKNSEKVFFTYTAKSIDGKVYYSEDPYNIYGNFLGYVKPEGWRLALAYLPRGGKIRVIIPSSLGFGRNGTVPFKGNEVLDCELDLFDVKTQPELDETLIKHFIQQNNLQMTKDSSGVYYQIINPGTETSIINTKATIEIAYTGKLLNGKVFDSATTDKPLTSPLNRLIQGWQETIPFIKKGGKIRILIPSALAYGGSATPSIPANSVLDFTVDLINVTNP